MLMLMYVRSTDRALDAIAWWPLLMTTAINLRASAASAAAQVTQKEKSTSCILRLFFT